MSAGAGRADVPARPPRDTRLDLVRGWLQISIFASHAWGTWIGVWFIHAAWGLSDSSEQFVFLSGFTLGSVFARKAARDGWRGAARDLLARTWRLYRTHLAVFAAFAVLVFAVGCLWLPGEPARLGWDALFAEPLRRLPWVLLTVEQPTWMSILPLFVWSMLLLPGFAWLEARTGNWALALPLGLYGFVWANGSWMPEGAWEARIGFNPLTWQMLFLLGAWCGRRALLRGRAMPFASRAGRAVTAGALLVLAAGLAVKLEWLGPGVAEAALPAWLTDKKDLAPGRALHALALAWAVAALVPREASWMHGAAQWMVAAIGRHSLQVFCLGLFLSWAGNLAFRQAGYSVVLDVLVIGTGTAVLGAYALHRERRRADATVPVPA